MPPYFLPILYLLLLKSGRYESPGIGKILAASGGKTLSPGNDKHLNFIYKEELSEECL
jgi:hypothetical protein